LLVEIAGPKAELHLRSSGWQGNTVRMQKAEARGEVGTVQRGEDPLTKSAKAEK